MITNNQAMPDHELAEAIGALLTPLYEPDAPGAAVIVVRAGEPVFRSGYGMANLELGVPIAPDMVFRLGSITKQFTAVAILMLAERGALALDDDITTFFPAYPTHGHTITVEHLLTHTSGIKSYTGMPEWDSLWRKDFTVEELIDFFKDQPMDFAPGEKWAYCNSGYVLLGAIVEKVSGQTYEQFLQQQIFEPLGMRRSYYDSTSRIIPRRVPGYSKGAEGYENAPYLSMSQPYAAGALAASVDDLALWDAALYTERLLRHETLRRAFTAATLNDGRPTGYGYGWCIGDYAGHPTIEHGGGIHGFITYALRMPDQGVFVAILTNNGSGEHNLEEIAVTIAALAIGRPYQAPAAIALDHESIDGYLGVYQVSEQEQQVVTRDGDQLFIQATGGPKEPIFPISPAEFFFKNSLARMRFVKGADGAIAGLELRGRIGPALFAGRVDRSAL